MAAEKKQNEDYLGYENEGGSASFEATHDTEEVTPICRQ